MKRFFKKGEYSRSVKVGTKPEDTFISRNIIDYETSGINQFRLGLLEIAPGNYAVPHKHNCDEIMYVLEGKGIFRIEDEEYIAEAGDSLYVPANAVHGPQTNTGDKTWRYLFVTGQTLNPLTWFDIVLPSGDKPNIEEID